MNGDTHEYEMGECGENMEWLEWFPYTLCILIFCLVCLDGGEGTKFLICLPFSLAIV